MLTNDNVITVSARVRQSTWTELKIRAAKEQKKISQVYDEAIRLYLGMDREVGHDD
jgi:hypothetical protein